MRTLFERFSLVFLQWLTFLFFLAYVFGFCCQFLGPRSPWLGMHMQLPLGGVQNVVVDARDQVNVGSSFYSRVQVYDSDGTFLYGFFAPISGVAKLGLDDNGRICVASSRGDLLLIYDPPRKVVVRQLGGRDALRLWSHEESRWTQDSVGRRYEVRRTLLSDSIVRKTPMGEEEVFVRNPLWLTPFVGPIPCLVGLCISASVAGMWKCYFRRRKRLAASAERSTSIGQSGIAAI